MIFSMTHLILAQGDSFEECEKYVRIFFDSTPLIKYQQLDFQAYFSARFDKDDFWEHLEEGISQNKEILVAFIADLRNSGINAVNDFKDMPQGYQSKLLHIVAHFLDGFIGVDSYFYNLVENSHWVSSSLRESLVITPERYFLLKVKGTNETKQTAAFIATSQMSV